MEPEKKSNGALVGSIIIIVILVIGGIYLWQTSLKDKNTPVNTTDNTLGLDSDLNSIDLDNLDQGI